MPDPYPNATFSPTRLARTRLENQQLNINDAIFVIRNFHTSSPGFKDNQRWYYGETQANIALRVLIEDHQHGDIRIVTVDFNA